MGGGCRRARPRSIPACCGWSPGSPRQRRPLGTPLDVRSPRVTFILVLNPHGGICPMGERDQGWDLEAAEHQQKRDGLSTRPEPSCPQPAAPGRGLAVFASILVQLAPRYAARQEGDGQSRTQAPPWQREGDATQNASQSPGNSSPAVRGGPRSHLTAPSAPVVPVLPNTRDSCPKPPAQTCEAGLAGGLRLLPLSAGTAKTPAKEGRKEKPLLASFFFFSSPFFPPLLVFPN